MSEGSLGVSWKHGVFMYQLCQQAHENKVTIIHHYQEHAQQYIQTGDRGSAYQETRLPGHLFHLAHPLEKDKTPFT